MKQHGRFLQIVSGLLVSASLVWLCAALVRPGIAQHSFVTAQEVETETCISVSGLIVRDELLLTADAPFLAVLPAEGEKVARRQAVAVVSTDAAILPEQSRVSSLNQMIQQLTTASAADPADADRTIRRLLLAQASNPPTETECGQVKSLILCLDNDPDQLQAALASAQTAYSALTASRPDTVLTSPDSGWFSSCADGWERIMNPKCLADINEKTLLSLQPETVSRNTYGKLILSETWYFVTRLPPSVLPELQETQTVPLSFAGTEFDQLDMTIERMDFQPSGQILLVLSCSRISGTITPLRCQTAVLHLNTRRGLRIPRSAIHVSSTGQTGVYVRAGAAARWKPVTLLDTSADSCIAALDLSSTANLWPGDEILLGSNLYDGKVVYP